MEITRGKIESAQKVVIYAPEGIGKSTFASKFPDSIFIDTEGSTKKLDVARTNPNPSSWTMLLEQVKHFIRNPHKLKTLIIDTIDWAEKLCIADVCASNKKSGIEDFGYGKGPHFVVEEFGKLLNLLTELIDKNVNVVLVAHAQTRKFDLPEETGSFDKWELKLTKFSGPLTKEWADMVLFANYKTFVVQTGEGMNKKNKPQGGNRVMYTSHHPCWDAKNRDGLADELFFDYKEIAHCIPTFTNKQRQEVREVREVEEIKEETLNIIEKDDLSDIPVALADLMRLNNVTREEIQQAVTSKGYYPLDTPISNYDSAFTNGVLVAAWGQVFKLIEDYRNVPF